MISAVTETSEASIDGKNSIINFLKLRNSQKNENFAENAFSSFCSIRWKFFKQTSLKSSKISKNILLLVLLSKMIILEVIRV